MKNKDNNVLNKLKELRKLHGLSCDEVAKKINVSRAYYWQIENGKRNLYYKTAVRISRVFNLKPDDIFYDDLK